MVIQRPDNAGTAKRFKRHRHIRWIISWLAPAEQLAASIGVDRRSLQFLF